MDLNMRKRLRPDTSGILGWLLGLCAISCLLASETNAQDMDLHAHDHEAAGDLSTTRPVPQHSTDAASSGATKRSGNLIDDHFTSYWSQNDVAPVKSTDSAEFLRRVTLDIIGRVPTLEEQDAFAISPDRAKLVDRLLASSEFSKFWAERLASLALGYALGDSAYDKTSLRGYIQSALQDDAGYDTIVRALLTATPDPYTGADHSAPGAFLGHYVIQTKDKRRLEALVSRISRVYLGNNMQCAQCHDYPHPKSPAASEYIRPIKQDDFYGMVAFFAKLEATENGIQENDRITYQPDKYKKPLNPRFIDSAPVEPTANLREFFADRLVQSKPFARTYVNRIWSYFFGRGIVVPLDNVVDAHAPLLDSLVDEAKAHKFNLRHLVRQIAMSRAYQTTSAGATQRHVEHFAAQRVRLLTPEQMFNALASATDLERAYVSAQLPKTAASTPRYGQGFEFIKQLFMDFITSTADFESVSQYPEYSATIRQYLSLLDISSVFYAGINPDHDGRLSALVASADDPKAVVRNIYRSALSREPTEEELTKCLTYFEEQHRSKRAYASLFWAVLNTNEFVFNH